MEPDGPPWFAPSCGFLWRQQRSASSRDKMTRKPRIYRQVQPETTGRGIPVPRSAPGPGWEDSCWLEPGSRGGELAQPPDRARHSRANSQPSASPGVVSRPERLDGPAYTAAPAKVCIMPDPQIRSASRLVRWRWTFTAFFPATTRFWSPVPRSSHGWWTGEQANALKAINRREKEKALVAA